MPPHSDLVTFRSWQELLRDPGSERHLVQIYRDHGFLADAVAAWLAPALEAGGGAILVCTPPSRARVLAVLDAAGARATAAHAEGRIAILDAADLWARICPAGTLDVPAFKALAAAHAARVRAACPAGGPIRAWGELVDLLWKRGEPAQAERLESAWNEVIDAEGIRLLCSYEMDNLAPRTHGGDLRRVCASHSQLVPEEDYARFEKALGRALVEVFGEGEAGMVRIEHSRRRGLPTGMPAAEAVLVGLHEAEPEAARRVLARTRAHLLGA